MTPFVPMLPLPQQAIGDFDGDGRVDVALIQHDRRGSSITVQLSDSAISSRLDADVTAIVERDIDHDGDLDLIATTPSGDMLVWINDGHGDFTRHDVSRATHLIRSPVLDRRGWPSPAAVTVQWTALSHAPPHRRHPIVTTRIRPPTLDECVPNLTRSLLPLFRAPPRILG